MREPHASPRTTRALTWLAVLSTLGLVYGLLLWMAYRLDGRFNLVVGVGARELWARRLPEDAFVRYEFTLSPSLADRDVHLALLALAVGLVAPRRALARGARFETADALVCAGALGLAFAGLWDLVFNVYSNCFVSTIALNVDGVPMLLAALLVLLCAPRRAAPLAQRAPTHPPYR